MDSHFPDTAGPTLHVVSVDPTLPGSDPDDQEDEPKLEDMGLGMDWGIETARTVAVSSKRECWVINPHTLDILYRVRFSDVVIH